MPEFLGNINKYFSILTQFINLKSFITSKCKYPKIYMMVQGMAQHNGQLKAREKYSEIDLI